MKSHPDLLVEIMFRAPSHLDGLVYKVKTVSFFLFQANIFTFVTSVETRTDLKLPGNIACENSGVMSKILADDEQSSFFDQMKAYFRYVEATKTLADPLLTDVYLSPIDDATTFTVSSAVVSNVTKK